MLLADATIAIYNWRFNIKLTPAGLFMKLNHIKTTTQSGQPLVITNEDLTGTKIYETLFGTLPSYIISLGQITQDNQATREEYTKAIARLVTNYIERVISKEATAFGRDYQRFMNNDNGNDNGNDNDEDDDDDDNNDKFRVPTNVVDQINNAVLSLLAFGQYNLSHQPKIMNWFENYFLATRQGSTIAVNHLIYRTLTDFLASQAFVDEINKIHIGEESDPQNVGNLTSGVGRIGEVNSLNDQPSQSDSTSDAGPTSTLNAETFIDHVWSSYWRDIVARVELLYIARGLHKHVDWPNYLRGSHLDVNAVQEGDSARFVPFPFTYWVPAYLTAIIILLWTTASTYIITIMVGTGFIKAFQAEDRSLTFPYSTWVVSGVFSSLWLVTSVLSYVDPDTLIRFYDESYVSYPDQFVAGWVERHRSLFFMPQVPLLALISSKAIVTDKLINLKKSDGWTCTYPSWEVRQGWSSQDHNWDWDDGSFDF